MYDPVLPALGRPRNLLIPFSDHLMCVVEIDEVGLSVPVIVPSALSVPVESMWTLKFSPPESPRKRQRAAGERTGELDRIAVRPVERAGHGILLLYELELQPEMLDRERPESP